ncbi:MAG TPA: FAD-binding oxidoreductase [Candidatus Paceibacterota bacterium]
MNIPTDSLQTMLAFLTEKKYDFTSDQSVLDLHSRDASAFVVRPKVVVYPRNNIEIRILAKKVNELEMKRQGAIGSIKRLVDSISQSLRIGSPKLNQAAVTLSTRAGGTCMSGGSLSTGIIINLTKYMNAFEVDFEAKMAEVEMGVMYRDLEAEMLTRNLFFSGYTSSKDICGVGGMIGNNSSGEKSILYGATIDNVESVDVVLSDGEIYTFGPLSPEEFVSKRSKDDAEGQIYRKIGKIIQQYSREIQAMRRPVPKCASGYRIERVYDKETGMLNLAPLFVGSQSTLGIITKARLRLNESRKAHALLAMPVASLSKLPGILQIIMAHKPESVETFDVNTLNSAQKFKPAEAGLVRTLFSAETELMILAEFAGDTIEEVHDVAETVRVRMQADCMVSPVHVTDMLLYQALWTIRRSSFGVMRDDVQGTNHAIPCIEDIIVPIRKFDVFIPELISILKNRNIKYGFHGHIGDGALRVIPIFDVSRPDIVRQISELCKAVFKLVHKLGGNMSADHSDGIIRSPFLKGFYGPRTYQMFVEIKNAFDPLNIWNPNKKVGGSIAEIEKYIIRK